MQPKLIRLLIVSRFSRPLIGLMIFMLAYAVLMSLFVPPEAVQIGPFWTFYIIGITAFFIILMTMIGGIAIMKSDLDYLFTLPLSRRDLAVSFYITQFLATGISYLLLFGYVFIFIGGSVPVKLVLAGDMVLIGLLQTAISIVAFRLETPQKALLAGGMGVYALLPLAGFSYSFTSIFTGDLFAGTVIIVVLNVIFNYFALSQLSTIELGFTKITSIRASAEYKRIERFVGLSQRAAIIRRYLSELSFTGRFNLGGSVSVRVSRVKLRIVLIPVSILAVVYAYISILFNPADGSPGVAIVMAAMYLGIFIPMFFPEVFSHERAWLAFSSMTAKTYWLYIVYAKMIQVFVMMTPFIATNIFLAFYGVHGAVNALIYVAAIIPTSPLISIFFSGRFSPAQIIDMETLPMEFSLRQLATLVPMVFYAAAAVVSMFSVILALGCTAFFGGFALLIILGDRRWNRIIYHLTERGYV